ncbi:MAG: putative Ig domain-containing protein [Planctomycetota bacterium]
MKLQSILCSAVLLLGLLASDTSHAQWTFVRGDVNADGSQNLQDAVVLLNYLFVPGATVPPCLDACDMNDDGALNLIDPINQLFALFQSGPPPASPYPNCGTDPTPDMLGCIGPLGTCPPEINNAPAITSTPVLSATEAQLYSYDVDATDPEPGDLLSYALTTAPSGATIDVLTGEITWTPTDAQNGLNSFTVQVSDDGSPALTDTQSFDVTVAGVNQPPVITSTPLLAAAEAFLYEYDVDATDADSSDSLTYSFDMAPSGAMIDAGTGLVGWTPSSTQTGMQSFTIRVTDNGVGALFATQSFIVTVVDNNQPPQITSTPVLTGMELAPYTYDVDAIDADPGDVLTYSFDQAPLGALIDAGTGLVEWTPQADQTGMQPFTVRATDDGAGTLSDIQSFMVDVADVNQAPVIHSTAPAAATELVPFTYMVDASDPDPADTLTYAFDLAPTGATISSAGVIQWVPSALQTGSQDFTVRVADNGVPAAATLQMFTVIVADVNQVPVINSSPVLTGEELLPYTYDVDATDPDPLDTLTYTLDLAPTGAVIAATTGIISWTPAASNVGANAFTVRVTDDGAGALFTTQSFSVVVGDVNQVPTITSTPLVTATEAALYTYDVDAVDPDVTDTLTFSLDMAPAGAGIDGVTGVITWTPSATQNGPQSFTVRATDNGVGNLFATQSFTVNVAGVNQMPLITSTPPLAAVELQPYVYDVAATDADGDSLLYSLLVAPSGATIDPISGVLDWTPTATQTGTQSFTVRVTDDGVGMLFDLQLFSVNVTDVNQPPAITSTPLTNATELQPYSYDVNAVDPDPTDTLLYSLEEGPTAATIDAGSGLVEWTPTALDAGSHFFRVRATDDGSPVTFAEQTFTLNVADVNQAPMITSTPPLTGTELVPYSYDVDATDIDSNTLTYTLDLAPTGASIDASTGLLQWTPDATHVGANPVIVRVTDNGVGALFDTQSFSIVVGDVNQMPVITTTPITVATEATAYSYDVDATDADVTDVLTFTLDIAPLGAMVDAVSGLISWTPNASQTGAQDFTVRVTDNGIGNLFALQSFTVLVTDINQQPTFTSTPPLTAVELQPFVYDLDAIDVDGDALTYELVVAPLGAMVNPTTGVINWTPTATQTGMQSFSARVTDDGVGMLFALQLFTVDVTNVNQPPVITSSAPTAGSELALYTYDVEANDPDPGDSLTFTLEEAPGTALISGAGEISWTPTALDAGPHPFRVRVADDGTPALFVEQTFTVNVADVNQPPVISSTPVLTATELVPYFYDVDATDVDINDTLTYSLDNAPATAMINSTSGVISWTPTASEVGANAFAVRVTDNGGGTLFDTQSFSVVVADVNQTPTITSVPVTTATEASPYSYDVDATDPDPLDTISYTLDVAPVGATINSSSGLIDWIPSATQTGMQSFTVRATDNGVGTLFVQQSFSVTVTDINQAPFFTSTPVVNAVELQAYSYDVDAQDPDNDDLTYSLVVAPAGAMISATTGQIQWMPTALQTGAQSFSVQVMDDGVGMLVELQLFTVSVTDINQAPTITSLPTTSATEGQSYTYDMESTDPDPLDDAIFSLEDAPTGATINPDNGLVEWTPTFQQAGSHFFRARVTDDGVPAMFVEQTFTVNVADVNQAPLITSTPVLVATELMSYLYDVDATDVDLANALTYSFDAAPGGASIDTMTGVILWIPDATQIGNQAFTIRVTDNGVGSLFDTQSFTVAVTDVNQPPVITSTPVTSGAEFDLYEYSVIAIDPDPTDTLTYTLPVKPVGMDIDAGTGVVSWTPGGTDAGTYPVIVRATDDGAGNEFVEQSFSLVIDPTNQAPQFTSTPPLTATAGSGYAYLITADDPDLGDVVTLSLTMAPSGVVFDPVLGTIDWTPDATHVGVVDFTVRASDGSLNTDQSWQVTVAPAPNLPPVITSTPVVTAAVGIDYVYEVLATDPDVSDMLTYSLENAPAAAMINAFGVIVWPVVGMDVGSHDFTVRVTDNGTGDLFVEQLFSVEVGYRINSGELTNIYIDDNGDVWTPDFGFDNPPSEKLTVSDAIAGTLDDMLYQNERFFLTSPTGNYTLPLPAAADYYTVRLLFGELFYASAGNRFFDVSIEGQLVLDNYDTFAAAGGQFIARDEVFEVFVSDGAFSLDFAERAIDHPKIAGIAISRSQVGAVAPTFTSTPPLTGFEDTLLTYPAIATDAVGDTLTYAIDAGPAGAMIDPVTGVLTWTPPVGSAGDQAFTIRATDQTSLFALQNFTVSVSVGVNFAPTIDTTPPMPETATVMVEYVYDVDASDANGSQTLTYSLESGPTGAGVDPTTGILTWTPTGLQLGMQTFTVRVTDDGAGNLFAEQTFVVDARYRINSGELAVEYLSDSGALFSTDFGFDNAPGEVISVTTPVLFTLDQDLFRKVRTTSTSSLTYSLPVPAAPDVYTLILFLAEIEFDNPGQRIFDVTAEGTTILDELDMVVEYGADHAEFLFFEVRVTDGAMDVSFLQGLAGSPIVNGIELAVSSGVNTPPSFTTTAPTQALEGQLFEYDADATDPDVGDVISYSLPVGPAAVSIDAGTGLISWTPQLADVGNHDFTVRATDAHGAAVDQDFVLEVVMMIVNQQPVITSTAPAFATVTVPMLYNVVATDPNPLDTLTYSLITAPGTASIDAGTGLISWTATADDIGMQAFTVRVTDDGTGMLFAEQSFMVDVCYRINSGSTVDYTGFDGAIWAADFGFDNPASEVFSNIVAITPTMDPQLYQSERFTFSPPMTYSLPTAAAATFYTVRLHFAEIGLPPAGVRQFDVLLEGALVLDDYDIDATVGLNVSTVQEFQVRVTDGMLDITFDQGSADLPKISAIEVCAGAGSNQAPTITTTASTMVFEEDTYFYDVDATDPNIGDVLTYSLMTAPTGAMINGVTGEVSWPTFAGDAGNYPFVVRVTDFQGLFDDESFTVVVSAPVNVMPMITSTAPTVATVAVQLQYNVLATDPNPSDTLSYSIESGPSGAMIDSMGLFTWTPLGTELGDQTFVVRVTDDGMGLLFDEQSFTIPVQYRINCGTTTDYLASDGSTWAADFGFDTPAGEVFSVTNTIAAGPMTADMAIYQTERFTFSPPMTYSLPVPPGNAVYSVALHFAEIGLNAVGARRFDVTLEGQTVLSDYDLFALFGMNQATVSSFDVRVTDGTLAISFLQGLADFPKISGIEVAPSTATNLPPTITSTAPTTAVEGTAFVYTGTATDPNIGDSVTFSLPTAPVGASVEATTGVFTWTPTMADVGVQSFVLRATDTHGATDDQPFDVTVSAASTNVAPQITSTPFLSATVAVPYDYQVVATDANVGDTLLYELIVFPAGATINSGTGEIQWEPTAAQFGDNAFTVRVSDDALDMDEQSFTVVVCYRINCGELNDVFVETTNAMGPNDKWSTDFGFDNPPANNFSITNPITNNGGLEDVFQVERFFFIPIGNYALSLPAGMTEVQVDLLFSEPFWTAPDQREFEVDIEGDPALTQYDIFSEVGIFAADIESFDVYVFDEELLVTLRTGAHDFAKINGIRVCPGTVTNVAPVISSTALLNAETGSNYSYDVDVMDGNLGDVITYTLPTAPTGATIDPATGLISWLPTVAAMEPFVVRATDVQGLFDEQSFTVDVILGTPMAPQITSNPSLVATVGVEYSYDIDATDANLGDMVSYSIESGPASATINANGEIFWTPTGAEMGTQSFTVRATDDSVSMLFVEQIFDVVVSYRINSGALVGDYMETMTDAVWAADFGFSNPGEDFTRGGGTVINNTDDPTLYLSERFTFGLNFNYELALPNGTYTVRLHFVETAFTAAGQRSFHVDLEGTQVLTDFDIIDEALMDPTLGGNSPVGWALRREFTAVVSDGMLTITFLEGTFNHPKISAVEVFVP